MLIGSFMDILLCEPLSTLPWDREDRSDVSRDLLGWKDESQATSLEQSQYTEHSPVESPRDKALMTLFESLDQTVPESDTFFFA